MKREEIEAEARTAIAELASGYVTETMVTEEIFARMIEISGYDLACRRNLPDAPPPYVYARLAVENK